MATHATPVAQRRMRKVLPWGYRLRCELEWRLSPRGRWSRQAAKHRWVFCVGVNRSGKTTLSNLLGHHPAVSVVPNAANMSEALPNSISERCPHVWAERSTRFRLTEQDLGRIDPTRLIFDWLTFNRRPKPVIVVESDVQAIQMRWLQHVFPHARFVAMVRNGYAVAEALREKEGYAIERCARQWSSANAQMLGDAPHVAHCMVVRYEDFVADPATVVAGLAEFMGLDAAPLERVIQRGWSLGNGTSRVSTLRDANGDMLARLSATDAAAITAVARPMLETLRYPLLTPPERGADHHGEPRTGSRRC
jgi:hypothetical protein